ncbi:hypothetical protein P9112_012555 [Eukaryota sp. TZLM1-RC]
MEESNRKRRWEKRQCWYLHLQLPLWSPTTRPPSPQKPESPQTSSFSQIPSTDVVVHDQPSVFSTPSESTTVSQQPTPSPTDSKSPTIETSQPAIQQESSEGRPRRRKLKIKL